MKLTLRCAEECDQEYGVVTYDLNASKPAVQIQATESPKYDAIFIMPGGFHIEMAFFKALGEIIAESGGPFVLTETSVIASGSLNSFLQGKNFNRCKRVHPILAVALQILHFNSFLDFHEGIDEMTDVLRDIDSAVSEEACKVLETSPVLNSSYTYMILIPPIQDYVMYSSKKPSLLG